MFSWPVFVRLLGKPIRSPYLDTKTLQTASAFSWNISFFKIQCNSQWYDRLAKIKSTRLKMKGLPLSRNTGFYEKGLWPQAFKIDDRLGHCSFPAYPPLAKQVSLRLWGNRHKCNSSATSLAREEKINSIHLTKSPEFNYIVEVWGWSLP